jgi:purine-binding chemotaxis protein CheW
MSTIQLATFNLNGVLWGVNILQVREILRRVEAAPVPQAPAHVRGLLNLRGQIVTLIDLALRLGQPATKGQMCLVLRNDAELAAVSASLDALEPTGDDSVGIFVDHMADVVAIDEQDIRPPPANTSAEERRFIRGVVSAQGELLLVLRLTPVLSV